ncbi:alpha/beta fold hydrolase [Gracilibacillus kekensis]|uniref:Pimeloyl-ACP methyl ester carboxylesterase n=1 Tax=Gracilibacillus kekensis TaxID=1027249 RepID=A0A1M7L644_9BACI|nr:alpha/beta hydrolase [Gracilibacillus kekensis]SHM73581.1 Pimeloyl-ACP methyl ester carboxylesterase [Gracilibacillus kekensis]
MEEKTIYKSKEGKRILSQKYEAYLETLPFDVERKYVDTSYGKTHVLVAGPPQGKPIFIFQGGNCINPMTLTWFTPLAKHYRIYAPDTIGHPGFSAENRISAKNHSFAQWIEELMNFFQIERCAFIGPSYGGGIILRLATFLPEKIDCAVLVSPAGIKLGSKLKMIKDILRPLALYNITSSEKHLQAIADKMSANSMKDIDKQIIGDVFQHVKLEQDMPKLTDKKELENFKAPTLVIAGLKDVFFPENKLRSRTQEIIPNLTAFKSYDMGHFPSEAYLEKMNVEIKQFLSNNYEMIDSQLGASFEYEASKW